MQYWNSSIIVVIRSFVVHLGIPSASNVYKFKDAFEMVRLIHDTDRHLMDLPWRWAMQYSSAWWGRNLFCHIITWSTFCPHLVSKIWAYASPSLNTPSSWLEVSHIRPFKISCSILYWSSTSGGAVEFWYVYAKTIMVSPLFSSFQLYSSNAIVFVISCLVLSILPPIMLTFLFHPILLCLLELSLSCAWCYII